MANRVALDKRVLLLNSGSAVAAKLLSLSVLVWLQQYLLKRVAAEEYALYPVIVAVMVFVRIFTTVLTSGIARYVTEAYAKGDDQRVTEIVSSMIPVMILGSLALSALGGVVVWKIDILLTLDRDQLFQARVMMGLMVFGMVVGLILMPYTVGFHVRQKFVRFNLILLGEQVLRAALLFTLLFAVSTRVQWVVVASVAANIAATVTMVWGSKRLVPTLRCQPALFRWHTVRLLVSFGGWNLLGMLAHRLHTSADAIILNKLGTASDVASYYIGALPDLRLNEMLDSATGVVQPALTAMQAHGDLEGLQRAYLKGNRYYLWASLLIGAVLIGFRREVTILYVGQEYIAAATVILLLHSGHPFRNASQMLYVIVGATGRIKGIMTFTLLAQIANVLLTIYLVGHLEMGAIGAALGTFVITVVGAGVLWPMGLRFLRLPLTRFLRSTVIPGFLPGCVCYVACEGLRTFIDVDTWLRLGGAASVGVVVYLIVLWGVLPAEDRSDARAAFRAGLYKLLPGKRSDDTR